MLVAKDRRPGTVFALLVERKGAADPHAVQMLAKWVYVLGSTQVTMRSGGKPIAGRRRSKRCKKGRICNHLGNVSAGDHGGNALAERAGRTGVWQGQDTQE